MRIRRWWLFIGCVGMLPYMGTQIYQKYRPSADWEQSSGGFIVHMKEYGVDQMLDSDAYISGVLAAALELDAHTETYKAMAVILRTYIAYMAQNGTIIESQTLGLSWLSPEQRRIKGVDDKKIQNAISETAGTMLYYENALILPLYYDVSNGTTRNFSDVWSGEVGYLTSVESTWDKKSPDYMKKHYLTRDKIGRLLDVDTSSAKTWNTQWIQIVEKDDAGYIKQIQLGGSTYTGEALRCLLGLNSACFEYEMKPGGIEFTCYGKGHGVGLSIYGANVMAEEGKSYIEILSWYFPGIHV